LSNPTITGRLGCDRLEPTRAVLAHRKSVEQAAKTKGAAPGSREIRCFGFSVPAGS
jgi:hypothetical protein